MANNSIVSMEKSNMASMHKKLEFLRLRLSSQYPSAKVIAMVSSKEKEGKTFILNQLALSLSSAGYKTLVINGNMLDESNRNSREEGNLSLYLKGDLANVIIKKPEEEHDYDKLNCTYEPNDSTRLLESDKFSNLILKLRELYDYILVDTPAFAKSIDAFLMGKHSDGVIYVVESDKNLEEDLREYKKILDEAKIQILGAILNKQSRQ